MKGLLVLMAVLAASAALAEPNSNITYTTDAALVNTPLDCAGQEFNWFSLQVSPNLPSPPVWSANGLDYNLLPPSDSLRLRLDVCLDTASDKMTLKRVVTLDYDRTIMLATITADATVTGLTEALSEQKYDGFRVELPLGDGTRYLIEGRRSGKDAYVTAVRTYLQDGKWVPASISIAAGKFEYGNSMTPGRCPLGQDFSTSRFRFGTASFTAEYCAYQGVGETTDYDFIGLSVTDSDPALGAEAGRTFALRSAEELKPPVLVYRHNHHDACDSFHLKLPHAEYAATTMPVAGCGLPVPEAPKRTMRDAEYGVRYRIRYGAGAWRDGLMKECGHYLFGCHVDEKKAVVQVESVMVPPPAFRHELDSLVDFTSLARQENGRTYLKYTLQLAEDAIYFQDTNRYPYHFNFLKNELPRYRDLGSAGYDDLLFTPGKKEVSAGALYYDAALRVPEYSEAGVLGFVVYFREGIDKAELSRVYRKLRETATFADKRITFAFERRADYFKLKMNLWPASCKANPDPENCIPSVPLDRFH